MFVCCDFLSSSFTSSILRGILFLIMSSFLFDSTIGMGDSDSGDSIQQPLMDREVISIGGSFLEDTRCGTSDSESSFSKRVRASCRTDGGTSCLHERAWPSADFGEPISINVILPSSASGEVRKGTGSGDARASPHVRRSHNTRFPLSLLSLLVMSE